jgi:hypothetical protein
MADFVGRTYKNEGGDARLAIQTLALPVIPKPADPPTAASETDKVIWGKDIDAYIKRREYLRQNVNAIYALAWGQCSDVMRQRLEALTTFQSLNDTGDGVRLFVQIKSIAFNFSTQKFTSQALMEAKQRFYNFTQGRTVPVSVYHEQFQSNVDVIIECGGQLFEPEVVNELAKKDGVDPDNMTPTEKAKYTGAALDMNLATVFVFNADKSRYGQFQTELENDYAQDVDHYPRTLVGAYKTLSNWVQEEVVHHNEKSCLYNCWSDYRVRIHC